jgi:hypothetical protein
LCGAAPAQQGTVVVFRSSKYVGSALKPSVYVDGKQVCRLSNGRYFSFQLPSGKHNFESSMKNQAPLEVDLKTGETTYLEMVLLPGNWRGGGRLIPVGADDAKSAIQKLKPLDGHYDAPDTSATAAQPESGTQSNQESPTSDSAKGASTPEQPSSVTVKSTPPGADISVDGKFMGNTPSTIQLAPGQHEMLVEKEGLRPWQRTLTIGAGGNISIDALLEKPQ